MVVNISCRVPWHDNEWIGTVCKNPEKNQSCRRCKSIADDILINKEKEFNGKYFNDITDEECENKPCIREGACFMCKDSIDVKVKHPYSFGYYFNNLEKTVETLPSYSYPFVPFRWLRKSFSDTDKYYLDEKTKRNGISYDKKLEEKIFRVIEEHNKIKNNDKKIKLNWVNDGRNQKEIFDYFVDRIIPNESLMFFYSKQVPFIEKNNRVLIGIGHALRINELIEYNRTGKDGIDSAYLWELMIEHSVRPNTCEDGFIFPFDKILKKQKEDVKFDINKAIVLIDNDYFEEFSYKSEIVSFEATIDTLNKIKQALEYDETNGIEFNYGEALDWIDREIEKAWMERGEFPGFGNLLCAYGIEGGVYIVEQVKALLKDSSNFWDDFNILLGKNLSKLTLTKKQKESVEDFKDNEWDNIYKNTDNKFMFDMLARISFDYWQMSKVVEILNNKTSLIQEIIENPYLLFELTMDLEENNPYKVKLKQLDYAFCKPDECLFDDINVINDKLRVRGSKDKRRLRAYVLDLLVKEAVNGNTVYPFKYVVNKVNDLRLDVDCDISEKTILDNKNFYEASGKCIVLASDENNDENYFKLKKYDEIDSIIRSFININIKKKNKLKIDWNKEYEKFVKNNGYELKEDWKEEDLDALDKLANNKFSILTGGAGTGKTSILSILCNEKSISNGGVLLLAPTGKAAVRMNQSIKLESKTLASFLLEAKLYKNGNYIIAPNNIQNSFNSYNTIIVDESSMLTEDMLGSLLSYIDTNVNRFILVGDYNQLPPIGAGRPFFDIIQYLRNNEKYKDNVIELYNNKRQVGENRIDIEFANCFKYENAEAKEFLDAHLMDISKNKSDVIEFEETNDSNFDDKVKEELVKSTRINGLPEERYMKDINDIEGFNRSIGKVCEDGKPWFNSSRDTSQKNGCGHFADNWQIITPIRGKNIGVQNINSLIHSTYKDEKFAEINKYNVPAPSGPENIMYGEKVIQITNDSNRYHYPKDLYSNYVANGEIGITCNWNKNSKYNNFNVEFSHKEGTTYSYYPSEIDSEDGSPLELAYALTIHKCQGSQFKNVVAVLKKDCGMLSKELIYTALTRHEDKLFIIGDENLDFLKDYINNTYSELAKRFTGLFELPDLIQYEDTYYQKGLIQIGDGGKLLRSKSEVVIWNKLHALDDKFTTIYEERFANGKTLPDFVVKDRSGEIKFIWEHLGFTKDKNYMRKWYEKEEIYRKNGFSVEKGNLIISKDVNNTIDSEDINKKIEYILNNIDKI